MFKQGKKGGFTLPEVLVTVAIIAVLAAAVVPAVTQQLGKADAPSFNASIGSLRTAITSFVADTRRFPGRVTDLQKVITTSDFDLSGDGLGTGAGTLAPLGVAYSAAVVARWRGPYENSGNETGVIDPGYGWSTLAGLRDTVGYVGLQLTKTGADETDALELDTAIDGGDGKNAGQIRWRSTTPPTLIPANRIFVFMMSSAR